MNDLNLTAWMIARGDTSDARGRVHRIALEEARRSTTPTWRERLAGIAGTFHLTRDADTTAQDCCPA